jgi:hypothetical protein
LKKERPMKCRAASIGVRRCSGKGAGVGGPSAARIGRVLGEDVESAVHHVADLVACITAHARGCKGAVILGNQDIEDVAERDAKTLIGAPTVKEYDSDIYVCIQLFDPNSVHHADVCRVDEVVVVGALSSGSLSRAVLDPGRSRAISSLVRIEEQCEIYLIDLPPDWLGRRFDEMLPIAKESLDVLLIAIEPAGGSLVVNPSGDYAFVAGDRLAVIAEHRPENLER